MVMVCSSFIHWIGHKEREWLQLWTSCSFLSLIALLLFTITLFTNSGSGSGVVVVPFFFTVLRVGQVTSSVTQSVISGDQLTKKLQLLSPKSIQWLVQDYWRIISLHLKAVMKQAIMLHRKKCWQKRAANEKENREPIEKILELTIFPEVGVCPSEIVVLPRNHI